jgi:hypothetical protein
LQATERRERAQTSGSQEIQGTREKQTRYSKGKSFLAEVSSTYIILGVQITFLKVFPIFIAF